MWFFCAAQVPVPESNSILKIPLSEVPFWKAREPIRHFLPDSSRDLSLQKEVFPRFHIRSFAADVCLKYACVGTFLVKASSSECAQNLSLSTASPQVVSRATAAASCGGGSPASYATLYTSPNPNSKKLKPKNHI
ncbi:hypothetical protein SASPL_107764 [Salvia splendens]|uniref:Uncharacterized protein n=1 Tax=Salvia splendens TaxID=180675 RepID=A0A8X8YBS3_SALSN|nr:hypothetical protein SASPL_107764 [Salvia splendens]